MEQHIKVESDHIHLMRGGDVLIYCMWIQNIMVDLIILKSHPLIRNKFNKPMPYKIPMIMVTERCRYWKKDFNDIKDEFTKLFNPEKDVKKKIDIIYILRNSLSHSHVKLGLKYFYYRPKSRKKLREAGVYFDLRKIPDQSNPIILKIDYSLEANYFRDFAIIQSLDQEYFSEVAKELGIVYDHIR